jgi:GNAT superfamily N-acetyltransferase
VRVSDDRAELDVGLIHRFLSEDSYWAKGRTREQVEASIEASVCVAGYEPGGTGTDEQVAFARAVTDSVSFAWICDVFVVPKARGHGYGKQIVGAILEHPSVTGVRNVVLGTADAHTLYDGFGFVPIDSARFMRRGAAGPSF